MPPLDRLTAALGVVVVYGLMTALVVKAHRQRRRQSEAARQALLPAASEASSGLRVLYASQTGQAERLALRTAQTLHTAGLSVPLGSLGELDAPTLQQAHTLLFVVSTSGEGDPPDSASGFVHSVMSGEALDLRHLHYGVLALGDRHYRQFCGFGRTLDDWLKAQGAVPLFERIEVDQEDPEALRSWQDHLAHLAGTQDLPDWEAPACSPWRLARRDHLNPGSLGDPVHHLELIPAPGQLLPTWEAGDLVQVQPPADPGRLRDYTIASIPSDRSVHLLVRQVRQRPDGQPGLASTWLTQDLALGEQVMLRLHAHRNFRIGDNTLRPLVLIGNGTGLAGLRSHWRARFKAPQPAAMWLIYGERQPHCDALHQGEVRTLLTAGVFDRVDLAYSRDPGHPKYVQHIVRGQAERLRQWVRRGAAVYVCGSLQGMATEVDQALRDVLGPPELDALAKAGRYRRDVY